MGQEPVINHSERDVLTPVFGCQQMTDSVGHLERAVVWDCVWNTLFLTKPEKSFRALENNILKSKNVNEPGITLLVKVDIYGGVHLINQDRKPLRLSKPAGESWN